MATRRKSGILAIATIILLLMNGCAAVRVHPTTYHAPPKGLRVYDVATYYIEGSSAAASPTTPAAALVTLPNFCHAYDIKPIAIFSKHDFNLKVTDGMLSELKSNQDTTSILSFLSDVADKAIDAATASPTGVTNTPSLGLGQGMYRFLPNGTLEKINNESRCQDWIAP